MSPESTPIHFEFATAGRIAFGNGTIKQAAAGAARYGSRALIVTGRSRDRCIGLLDDLKGAGISCEVFSVTGEPALNTVVAGAEFARSFPCSMVMGMGGGSVIDAAKAIAALITNTDNIYDYLEVVGQGRPLQHAPLPCIAIPTTAGTGSEVTRNAVLLAEREQVKVSLRSPLMLPVLAIVDPELTVSLPPNVTATTGLDALTQVIEPFVSNSPNPLTDGICREAIIRGGRSLLQTCQDGRDIAARNDMCLVSLFGGIALANSRLGAVHGLAGPIGGLFPGAHHGAICARLLPEVMQTNLNAIRSRAPALTMRFHEVARLLTGRPDASAEEGIDWLRDLVGKLPIPRLADEGMSPNDFARIIAQSRKSSSMRGNPVELSDGELNSVLTAAL